MSLSHLPRLPSEDCRSGPSTIEFDHLTGKPRRKNLIIVCRGPGAPTMTREPAATWDWIEICWHPQSERLACDKIIFDPNRQLRKYCSLYKHVPAEELRLYESIAILDDDIQVADHTWSEVLACFASTDASVGHPALTRDSWSAWPILWKGTIAASVASPTSPVSLSFDDSIVWRETNFVENQAILLTSEACTRYLPMFADNMYGGGMEDVFRDGEPFLAVLDKTPVRCTRAANAADAKTGLIFDMDETITAFRDRNKLQHIPPFLIAAHMDDGRRITVHKPLLAYQTLRWHANAISKAEGTEKTRMTEKPIEPTRLEPRPVTAVNEVNESWDIIFIGTPAGEHATGRTLRERSLSGTAQHSIFLAEEFARRGLRVLMLAPTDRIDVYEGVTYAPIPIQERQKLKTAVLIDVRFETVTSIEYQQRILFCTVALEIERPSLSYCWEHLGPDHRALTDLVVVSSFQIDLFNRSAYQGWKSMQAFPAILPPSVVSGGRPPKHPHRFIYASSVRKGLPETLALWADLLPQLPPDAELVITGPGYDVDQMPSSLPPRARYLGSMPFDDFVDVMRDCGAMLFVNTYTECFPFPLAMATAMGLRTHVLLRAGRGGIPEISKSDFVTDDEAKLRADILKAIDRPWAAGPTRLDFSAKSVADQWIDIMPYLKPHATIPPNSTQTQTIYANVIAEAKAQMSRGRPPVNAAATPASSIPIGDLTLEEQENIRLALCFLRAKLDGWPALAAVTGIQQQKLASLAKRGKPDASVAIRIARAAGVDINSLLAGAWPASLCPRCGEPGSQRSNAVGATTITIDTEHPIAKSSPDHTHPFGTKQDNSRNGAFNKKLYSLYNRPMSVMDLGCSGGGFVKDCLDDGHMAIGLEGSDYSRNAGRAEWSTIPESLFTCDISKPFSVIGDGMPAMFDTVTAWEVLEHLKEDELEVLSSNVRAHLHPQGLWITSVATCPDFQNGVHLHQTVHPREWWEAWFLTNGWCVDQRLISFFGRDWVRVNPRVNPGNGFNTVLRRSSRW